MFNGTYPVSRFLTDQSGNIYISTSGAFGSGSLTTKVTIATGGNVGIGTTSPGSILDVNHSVDGGACELILNNSAAVGSTNEFTNIRFRHAGKTGAFIKVGREADLSTAANTDNFMALWTTENYSPSEKLRIQSDGNVGIGTASPSTYLDVEFSDTTSYASGNGNSRGLDITNAATDNNTQFASLQLATLNNTNGTGSLGFTLSMKTRPLVRHQWLLQPETLLLLYLKRCVSKVMAMLA